EKLLATRQLHPPEAQAEILRFYDATITDDYAFANQLNPKQPEITDSIHDTELVFNALLNGVPVEPKSGLTAMEVVDTRLKQMQLRMQGSQQMGNIGTPQEVLGLAMAVRYTQAYIQQLAQDKNEKQRVSQYQKALMAIINLIKGFQQRQQEMAQK